MKLSNIGEFGLIHAIQKLSVRRSPDTMIGIGDDAAVLKLSPSVLLLASTDMLIEGVHFDLSFTDYYSLGWKSAAVNLSDIAAMGGTPRFCLTSLALPAHIAVEAVKEYYRGFNGLIRKHKTALVGGDTCSSKDRLVISVTVLGEAKQPVTRTGAKQGDRIFVTGTLGDSGAGLELLKSGAAGKDPKAKNNTPRSDIEKLVGKHLRPSPRVEWGSQIARSGCASSMIDVSDGLSSDLFHLCEESRVGAVLRSDALPISGSFLKSAYRLQRSPLHYVLSGGEDYELLFTVPLARMKRVEAFTFPVTEIGMITGGHKMVLMDAAGRKTAIRPTGYNHFSRIGNCAKQTL
jgi:thiamine-monophosphate kinase